MHEPKLSHERFYVRPFRNASGRGAPFVRFVICCRRRAGSTPFGFVVFRRAHVGLFLVNKTGCGWSVCGEFRRGGVSVFG